MISIKGRLLKIASMVEPCTIAADIGTDHAYIPIYLVQSGTCKKTIATDIKKGPLQKAVQNINKYNLADQIELRQGDGIKPVQEGESDVFIVAGMGGVVIADILDNSFNTVKNADTLILQPMYAEEVLREYLYQKGFHIQMECLVYDEKRLYVVIKACYDGIIREDETVYYHIGRALFDHHDPLLKEFVQKRIRRQTKIVHGLGKSEKLDKGVYEKEHALLKQMKNAYTAYFKETV